MIELNKKQRGAVEFKGKHLLVNSAPGSGKTLVIIERVNWILTHGRTESPTFLLLTFTNHAASVMKERIDAGIIDNVHASTFHSFCYKVLRDNGVNCTVIDEDDQKKVLTQVCKKHNMKTFTSILEHINYSKSLNQSYQKHIKICEEYDQYLADHNYVDFGDLQIKALEYLPLITYDHVLVDEFHDTSPVQMEVVKLLEPRCKTLTVVCDDQQSIYGWRGADINNILNFSKIFPSTVVVTLDRNYRSTKTIVKSINNLITHTNEKLCSKDLYTERKQGADIYVTECVNDEEESQLVAERIKKIYDKTNRYDNNLILFRTNSQSRAIEYSLLNNHIPYHLVAATSFYRRKEVKDVLAYLKYIANTKDEISLQRIINTPTRGIGKTTIDKLTMTYGSLCAVVDVSTGLERVNDKIYYFKEMISGLVFHKDIWKIGDMIKNVLECTQYLKSLKEDESEENKKRLENIDSMLSNAYYLQEKYGYTLEDYLGMISLMSDADSSDEEGSVKIMTIHAAKGMECEFVHVVGVETNVLPYIGCDVNEERRLMYVAVSRAKDMCMLTYCQKRMLGGRFMFTGRSVFIDQLLEERSYS